MDVETFRVFWVVMFFILVGLISVITATVVSVREMSQQNVIEACDNQCDNMGMDLVGITMTSTGHGRECHCEFEDIE